MAESKPGSLIEASQNLVDAANQVYEAAQQDDKSPLKNGAAMRRDGAQARSQLDYDIVVFAGDLNGFKRINDDAGHDAGDAALFRVGEILYEIAESEGAQAYRPSGDEFVVIAPKEAFTSLQQKLTESFQRLKIEYKEKEHWISMSFGAAISDESSDFDTIFRRADDACRFAKEKGDGEVVVWDSELKKTGLVDKRLRCPNCHTSIRVLVFSDTPDSVQIKVCPICTHTVVDQEGSS